MTPPGAGVSRLRVATQLGFVAGVASAGCGAVLWLAGSYLPFEPPVHTWVLAAGAALGVAGLLLQLVSRWSWSSGPLALLGTLLAAAFVGVLVGPVRLSARTLEPLDYASAPRRTQQVRVLSYNVLHGYPHFVDQEERFAKLADELRGLEPDVALFQEAWCTRAHGCLINRLASGDGPFAGYHLAYAGVNGSLRLIGFEEGLAIASRWPIEDVTVDVLRPRERPWRRRAVLRVTLRLDDQRWVFATAHLTNLDAESRRAQATSLAARLPPAGALLLGADLNDPQGTATVSPLTERGLEPVLGGARDHVLVRGLPPGWAVTGARWLLQPAERDPGSGLPVLPAPLSDHPAAWVEIERRPRSASPDAP
jgi:endonuclease/exonuclease/phosphatase family metal-dependent hydrolase